MASQTLIFVALPNGLAAHNKLKLSIYLTPRLAHGTTLGTFPDILAWPQLIKSQGLQFQIVCGTQKVTVSADKTILRPDIWQAIFNANTFVEQYQFPPFDRSLIVSYPVRQAMGYLKFAYQFAGTHGSEREGRLLVTLLEPLVFRTSGNSVLDHELSLKRVQMWREQHDSSGPGIQAHPLNATGSGTLPPDGTPTTLQPPDPAATHDMITRFALFHNLPPAHHRPPLPAPNGGFAKTLDFHKALTALNSYPSLLRALGLVFDVEIPASLCPTSPHAGAYRTLAVDKVMPGFKLKLTTKFNQTATSYWRDSGSFTAAPATDPSSQATGNYQPSDVFKGLLALSGQDFQLIQVDLDGALLKALGLADNVQNLVDRGRLSVLEQVLPSLRSAGISLMANGRGLQLLNSIQDNKAFDDSLSSNSTAPRPYNARDLVRGYRIDIWSSRTRRWHSLHSRNATYGFGPTGAIKIKQLEEGFTQLAAAQPAEDPTRKTNKIASQNHIPQPDTDIYLHERVARWDGWSLSATRPGKVLNRSPDPALATQSDPTTNAPVTPFKMTTEFTAAAGSLPELRFGANYRLRARAVDLAGNSVPLDTSTPDAFASPASGVQLKYQRFEPVPPPLVVLREPTSAGASLERLVIRSFNSDPSRDHTATTETDERHLAAPRAAVRLVEQHGMLDEKGKLKGDLSTYQMLTQRDSFDFATQKTPDGKVPLEPASKLNIGYLPDPISRGAALRNLPNTPNDTNGRIGKHGLRFELLPDVDARPGSVTYIDFGTQAWPNESSFRLLLAEGSDLPHWDSAERVLKVSLPKASVVPIPLSSFLAAPDLDIMGVWGWLRELFEAAELSAVQNPNADSVLASTSDNVAQVTRLVLEGGHEMLTPSRTLLLVHAVQQPLGEPAFLQLPVVHNPSAPIFASALRNSFTPITAWRVVGSHEAVLLGGLRIHGASSAKIELQSRWLEFIDDPSLPGPTKKTAAQSVETFDVSTLTAGPIFSDASQTRMVAVYIPQVDVLWFSAPFDELEGVANPSTTDVAAPVHRFDDTRHRWVVYTAVATSRFQEYFPGKGLDFTRSSATLAVDVPSSARPAIPDLNYVVPVFGWEQQETSNVKTSVRFGNGLRIYLNRGWYSSGPDEQLGVVLWSNASPPPDYDTRERFKALFSQWGVDPIWANGALTAPVPPLPTAGDFPNAKSTATGLTIPETNLLFDVAAHDVAFDSTRKLWYCDVQISNLFVYSPFVRLALARYQSHSIQGVELSPVQIADFAQLAPDRSAVLSINPADPKRAKLFVGGLAPLGPLLSLIEVTVERRALNINSDLDWQPAPANLVQVVEDAPPPVEDNAVLWSGTIAFAKTPPRGQFRVVIKEFETLEADAASGKLADPPVTQQRLVYAAIIPYDFP